MIYRAMEREPLNIRKRTRKRIQKLPKLKFYSLLSVIRIWLALMEGKLLVQSDDRELNMIRSVLKAARNSASVLLMNLN